MIHEIDARSNPTEQTTYYVLDDLQYEASGTDSTRYRFDTMEEAIEKFKTLPVKYASTLGVSYITPGENTPQEVDLVQRNAGVLFIPEEYLERDFVKELPNNYELLKEVVDDLEISWESDTHIFGENNRVLLPIYGDQTATGTVTGNALLPTEPDNITSSIESYFNDAVGWQSPKDFFESLQKSMNPTSFDAPIPRITHVNVFYQDMETRSKNMMVIPIQNYKLLLEQKKEEMKYFVEYANTKTPMQSLDDALNLFKTFPKTVNAAISYEWKKDYSLKQGDGVMVHKENGETFLDGKFDDDFRNHMIPISKEEVKNVVNSLVIDWKSAEISFPDKLSGSKSFEVLMPYICMNREFNYLQGVSVVPDDSKLLDTAIIGIEFEDIGWKDMKDSFHMLRQHAMDAIKTGNPPVKPRVWEYNVICKDMEGSLVSVHLPPDAYYNMAKSQSLFRDTLTNQIDNAKNRSMTTSNLTGQSPNKETMKKGDLHNERTEL